MDEVARSRIKDKEEVMHNVIPIPEGHHYESGVCPNAGNACNCIGVCRTELVKDDNCECGGTGYVVRPYLDITYFSSITRPLKH